VIADGLRVCPWCHTVLEFSGGQLVDVRGPEDSCEGCRRWIAILERARELQAIADAKQPEKPAEVDLNDYGAILARLRGDKQPAPVRDWQMAAAGERESE
jgi:hypothetical protein